MTPTSVWRVVTPIQGRFGNARWHHPLIVARFENDAIRIMDQLANELGISFDGDIQVQHVANATSEEGE